MGNGDGPAIWPKWAEAELFSVKVPFTLLGENAVIERLHADMFSGDVEKVQIEVRIDFPDRPRYDKHREKGEITQPTGDVFYLPIRFYSRDDLIKTIEQQELERRHKKSERDIKEAQVYSQRMSKRVEIDNIISNIVQELR